MKFSVSALVAGLFACAPFAAHAQDISPRVEARLGYETPTVSGDGDVYKIGSAVSYGGEVGVDISANSHVSIGPYATFEGSSVTLCDGGDCLRVQNHLGVGGRVSYRLGDRGARLYAKLGYAQLKMKIDSSLGSASDSAKGVQGAIGVTFDIKPKIYVLAEVNYADYGKFYGINLQRRHVATGIGIRF